MSTPAPSQPVSSSRLSSSRALAVAGLLIVVLAILLLLSPAERQLGNLVKTIYLHGALARTGMLALIAAGGLGLLYLIRPRPAWLRWSNAVQVAGMVAFIVHFLISTIPTHETWGMWIAFDEPRTVMSLQIIGVGLLVIVVRRLLDEDRLSALANLLLGAAVALLSARTGVLRHPFNPIGDSTSPAIQAFYAAIVITCMALILLLAWWLATRPQQTKPGDMA